LPRVPRQWRKSSPSSRFVLGLDEFIGATLY
jgi:hypothetical protein